VVGSRRFTEYGKAACEELIASLRGLPVVIVSGLAYGIDSIAHEAALKNGIKTVAVPGSGLDDASLYPAAHIGLARRILAAGGALFSPFAETTMGNDWTFPFRNRIMAGMSRATLIIEAKVPSGTLITTKWAGDFNRDVLAVPGNILSPLSAGPHMLIRIGATPIMCGEDLVRALGFKPETKRLPIIPGGLDEMEKKAFEMLAEPLARDDLAESLGLNAATTNALISSLELKGLIEEKLGLLRRV